MTNSDESFNMPAHQGWNPQKLPGSARLQILAKSDGNTRVMFYVFAGDRGSGKFAPSAQARKTSDSFDSSNNDRITLCAFKRRPIVLNICPRNRSGAGAVARTSKL